MQSAEIRANSDYQVFDFDPDGRIGHIGERMRKKLKALDGVMPDLDGKTLLDIGCDFGFWSFLASERGARVTGLDRSRRVNGFGFVDIPALNNDIAQIFPLHIKCAFYPYEMGVQWHDWGKHDVVLLMSLYHHVFENTGGDHECIWHWLWRHTGETLIWENPVDNRDRVVQMNVSEQLHARYKRDFILDTATKYFDLVEERPALHEPHRFVWVMRPKKREPRKYTGTVRSGAGGASKAFEYAEGRRMMEIFTKLGIKPYPGSLNVMLDEDFNWSEGYYRTLLLDVADRSKGLESDWMPRIMRFYPVDINGREAFVMRFEGESYPLNMVELIAPERLRQYVTDEVTISK